MVFRSDWKIEQGEGKSLLLYRTDQKKRSERFFVGKPQILKVHKIFFYPFLK